jgi:putative SOS response-associated peptidase YedK
MAIRPHVGRRASERARCRTSGNEMRDWPLRDGLPKRLLYIYTVRGTALQSKEIMCGRYVTPEEAEAERIFRVHRIGWAFLRSYNVAPSQRVPVVRMSGGEREGVSLRWGLVPFFAKGMPPKYSTINAAIEKLKDSPCWRGPWARAQRCILPATGFYEWHVNEDGSKTPFYISCADQPVFGLAGIWESSRADDGSVIESCAIITMPPNPLLAEIHNARQRMPAILQSQDIDLWLTDSEDQARAALKPYPADSMVAWPVSPRVNSPKNDDAQLIERR